MMDLMSGADPDTKLTEKETREMNRQIANKLREHNKRRDRDEPELHSIEEIGITTKDQGYASLFHFAQAAGGIKEHASNIGRAVSLQDSKQNCSMAKINMTILAEILRWQAGARDANDERSNSKKEAVAFAASAIAASKAQRVIRALNIDASDVEENGGGGANGKTNKDNAQVPSPVLFFDRLVASR